MGWVGVAMLLVGAEGEGEGEGEEEEQGRVCREAERREILEGMEWKCLGGWVEILE